MPERVQYEWTLNDLLTPKVESADKAVNKFEGTLGGVTRAANSVAAALGVAFGISAIVAFGNSVVDAGSKVENSLTGLTTLLKDKAKAQEVINNTMFDATQTPFAFEGLLDANKALISANVSASDARKTVLDLSNAIAATGGGDVELQRMVVNLQQIKNVGQATAMDIKQFAIAGVNIYQVLADATGKPISKVKDMTVSYDLLTYALSKARQEGGLYANGLENMAGNTSVQISNIGDAVFQLKVKMFNDLKPAIDGVITGLQSLVGSLSNAWDWMVRNKETIADLSGYVGAIAGTYAGYKLVLMGVTSWQWLSTAAVGAWTTAQELALAWDIARAEGLGLLTAAQWALNVAMNANPIGVIIGAVSLLVGGLVLAYNKSETFRAILSGLWELAKDGAKIFFGLGEAILGALTFNPSMVKDGLKTALDAANDTATAFGRGYDQSMAESEKDKEKPNTTGTVKAKATAVTPTGGGIPKGKEKDSASKVSGQKTVNIHVKISDGLVKNFNVTLNNTKEMPGKIKDHVVKALTEAVNDFQIVAGS